MSFGCWWHLILASTALEKGYEPFLRPTIHPHVFSPQPLDWFKLKLWNASKVKERLGNFNLDLKNHFGPVRKTQRNSVYVPYSVFPLKSGVFFIAKWTTSWYLLVHNCCALHIFEIWMQRPLRILWLPSKAQDVSRTWVEPTLFFEPSARLEYFYTEKICAEMPGLLEQCFTFPNLLKGTRKSLVKNCQSLL